MNIRKNIGLWMDYEKAYIVALHNGTEMFSLIHSNVEGRIRLFGGARASTPYGSQDVSCERNLLERRKNRLRQYFDKIIKELNEAQSILIFGPGQAKIELEKEIKKSKALMPRIIAVETVDKMTEKQIVAKVRKFFVRN